jgi:hypothetical protein
MVVWIKHSPQTSYLTDGLGHLYEPSGDEDQAFCFAASSCQDDLTSLSFEPITELSVRVSIHHSPRGNVSRSCRLTPDPNVKLSTPFTYSASHDLIDSHDLISTQAGCLLRSSMRRMARIPPEVDPHNRND